MTPPTLLSELHNAFDMMLAQIIRLDPTFKPTKTAYWPIMQRLYLAVMQEREGEVTGPALDKDAALQTFMERVYPKSGPYRGVAPELAEEGWRDGWAAAMKLNHPKENRDGPDSTPPVL